MCTKLSHPHQTHPAITPGYAKLFSTKIMDNMELQFSIHFDIINAIDVYVYIHSIAAL